MTRAVPRTNFNSSRLIRTLADLTLLDASPVGPAFAERLGSWVGVADAITLFAAHAKPATANGKTVVARRGLSGFALGEEVARVRAALLNSITGSCELAAGSRRFKFPIPDLSNVPDSAPAYDPYRRFYLAHQREMELKLAPLRANVRAVLEQVSPQLKQLAVLDQVFDGVLRERESRLLATLPRLLERCFEQLFQAHRQALVESQRADEPASWMQAGGWLKIFCNELQAVLLAELDLRLQPILGLIEAFSNESTQQQ